tara:strand:- start:675 stop:2516 length:1842 start_codon:yes stop_codon:yes gene_type:complete
MATNITSTALDFDTIKNSLKTYFAQQPEFSDYNFETSGLSNILDVLAYNTHFNGLTANFATNEAFLNTAQLRSSVVSHAEALGYRPRSRTPSSSSLTLYVNLSGVTNRPSSITLNSGWEFNASNESETFKFITDKNYTAEDDGNGLYSFTDVNGNSNIKVFQGEFKTKTFIVDDTAENQIYVIPDESLDTGKITVNVYDTPTSTKFTSYYFLDTALTVDSTTAFFDIKEAPNGYYEINFGDGKSFGKSPAIGSKVVVRYFSSRGTDANGCSGFKSANSYVLNDVNYPVNIQTQKSSTEGYEKETIESIRKLAPLQFASQKRLVTSADYRSMILSNFPVVKDVAVWGGEDNVPIDYGKVYISLQYQDGTSESVKTETQNNIETNFTNQLSVMSISNKYVTPEETYLEITGNFNYDPSLTNDTGSAIQTSITNFLQEYFTNTLNSFNSSFSRSEVLTEVSDLNRAILSAKMNIKVQQRLNVTVGSPKNYNIYFPVVLIPAEAQDYSIESSMFTYGDDAVRCTVKNKLNSNILQVVSTTGTVIVEDIGSYNYQKGSVNLNGFAPVSISTGTPYITFSSTPLDQSMISPLRNYVLRLDTAKLRMQPLKNEQDTKVAL